MLRQTRWSGPKPDADKTFLISLWPQLQEVSWQEELAGTGRRRRFVCFFLLGKFVWLSGPRCFCDTRAAPPAPLLASYVLIFYWEDAGVVRDNLFMESQLSISAQTLGQLDSFFPLSEEPFAYISFFFFFFFFFSLCWRLRNASGMHLVALLSQAGSPGDVLISWSTAH